MLEPREEFRGGADIQEAANGERIVVARGLVVEHDVVGARNAHEVVASGGGEQDQEIVRGILIGGGVIRVADVAAHRQAEQLAHEMIFEACADDLALVEKIFGADEADDTVDKERIEDARDAVGAGFERELIDAVMSLGGKRASLPGFEYMTLPPFQAMSRRR